MFFAFLKYSDLNTENWVLNIDYYFLPSEIQIQIINIRHSTLNFQLLTIQPISPFNNINFKVGSQTAEATSVTNFSGATFGQTTAAYQDLSTTNDVGGRMVQIVVRINF